MQALKAFIAALMVCGNLGAQTAPAEELAESIALQFAPRDPFWDDFTVDEQRDHTCARTIGSSPNGQPLLVVAAFGEAESGALKLLKVNDVGGYNVIYEPSNLDLLGAYCGLELVDIDADGLDEAHVIYNNGKGVSTDWIFKIQNNQLENITPTKTDEDGVASSLLYNALLFDLHHDGTFSILSAGNLPYSGDSNVKGDKVYSFRNGTYVQEAATTYCFREFYRGKAKPKAETAYFTVPPGAAGPFELHVVNGGRHKDAPPGSADAIALDGPVSSGRIFLNGVEVVSPHLFNPNRQQFVVSVNNIRRGENELKVQLQGPPGGKITVLLHDVSGAPSH
jgi:hypothetical protein